MKIISLCFLILSLSIGCQTVKKNSGEPSLSNILVQKGIQYMENNMLDIALEDLNRALELDDHNSEAHDAIAVLYERLNKPLDAEKHYIKALDLNAENTDALNNYGRFLCDKGKFDQAMIYIERLIASQSFKKPWLSYTNAGICSKNMGKDLEAEAYFRKALDENQAFQPPLLEMAKLSLKNQQYLSARGFIQRFEAASSMNSESLWIAIQTEHSLGNVSATDHYVKKLRAQFPNSKETIEALQLIH